MEKIPIENTKRIAKALQKRKAFTVCLKVETLESLGTWDFKNFGLAGQDQVLIFVDRDKKTYWSGKNTFKYPISPTSCDFQTIAELEKLKESEIVNTVVYW